MINFKQFENKSDTYYIIIDMERGVIENTQVYDDKKSAYNWIRNFVHENILYMPEERYYNEIKNEFDPYELLDFYNEIQKINGFEMHLIKQTLSPQTKLDKDLELRMTSDKYNL